MAIKHFFLIVFPLTLLNGCSVFNEDSIPKQGKPPEKTSVLWHISGRGAEPHCYILATNFPNCYGGLPHNDEYGIAMANAEQVMLKYEKPLMQTYESLIHNAYMKPVQTLDSILNDQEIAKLKDFLKNKAGINYQRVKRVPPLVVAQLIIPKINRCGSNNTYEKQALNSAYRGSAAPMHAFTKNFLADLYVNQIPYESQADYLLKTIDRYDSVKKSIWEANDYYKLPNYVKAAESARKARPFLKGFYSELVMQVNKEWVDAIKKAVRDKPTCVLVNVEHLTGQEGILNMLREKGFKVKPYNSDEHSKSQKEQIQRIKQRKEAE